MLKEVNMDFTRTMNKIIFDLHLEYASGEGLMATVSKPVKKYASRFQCCARTLVLQQALRDVLWFTLVLLQVRAAPA
jgi:hypothetical protein